jgi:hypothetical protein
MERFLYAKDRTFSQFHEREERNWKGDFFFVVMADTQFGFFEMERGGLSWEKEKELAERFSQSNRLTF